MNKDVIYIEPEDDITDIINRLKSAKKKVVALVPPKKAGVLKSSVNAKLITKAAKQSEKVAVIITSDPSLIKIVSLAGLPIAKNLESRPVTPSELIDRAKKRVEKEKEEEIVEEAEEPEEETIDEPEKQEKSEEDIELNSEEVDDMEDEEKEKKKKKGVKIPSFDKYRKFILIGVGVLIIAIVGVLAVVFNAAGKADISVIVKTTDHGFSEGVSLVKNEADAKPEEGKLYLEKVSFDGESTTEFEATGQRNDGEKASGTLTASVTFKASSDSGIVIPAGSAFSAGGKNYFSQADVTIANPDDCKKADYTSGKCVNNVDFTVVAEAGGAAYNIEAGNSFVNNYVGSVTNKAGFSGGTDKMVKYVTDKDVETAKQSLSMDPDAKAKLLDTIKDDVTAIESSFKIETGDVVSTPKVNEVVEEGKKAQLKAKSTYSIFAVDNVQIEKFIKKKAGADVSDGMKIYSLGKPFFERFVDDANNYTAKIKTTYKTGPIVSEAEIMEKSKGKKIGEVRALLESINGVKSVDITTNFMWVHSIPNDENKITIKLDVEE